MKALASKGGESELGIVALTLAGSERRCHASTALASNATTAIYRERLQMAGGKPVRASMSLPTPEAAETYAKACSQAYRHN